MEHSSMVFEDYLQRLKPLHSEARLVTSPESSERIAWVAANIEQSSRKCLLHVPLATFEEAHMLW